MNPEYSHPARSHLWCASCRCLEESAQRRLLYAYPGTPEIEATLLYLCPSVRARLFPPSPPLFFSLVRPIAHARIRACVRACVVNRGKREILYFCQPGIVRLIVRFRDWNLSKSFFPFAKRSKITEIDIDLRRPRAVLLMELSKLLGEALELFYERHAAVTGKKLVYNSLYLWIPMKYQLRKRDGKYVGGRRIRRNEGSSRISVKVSSLSKSKSIQSSNLPIDAAHKWIELKVEIKSRNFVNSFERNILRFARTDIEMKR